MPLISAEWRLRLDRSARSPVERVRDVGSRVVHQVWRVGWPLGLACALGVLLAAVQILPTVELAPRSIRSGGLSYREAVAFSLKPAPRLLWHGFLPPWGRNLANVFGGDYYTEYLAYIGVIPLLLAGLGAFAALCARHPRPGTGARRGSGTWFSLRMLALGAAGLFLALGLYNPLYWVLYRVVPGFSLFRVPARWLLLYAFGAAMFGRGGFRPPSRVDGPAPWARH